MPAELAAVVAVALAIVGVFGIVIPVLPGSLTIVVALLVWAVAIGTPQGWMVLFVGTVLVAAGASASYLLTGRQLRHREVPSRSVAVGVGCGVLGLFLVPFVGLPLGFVVGLLGMEWWRVQNLRQALSTSWAALRAVGLGMLLEVTGGLLAAATLLAGMLVTFG